MRILILGGDGYLGWPTAMHLTSHGHDVAVVDNYLRRRLCREEDVGPLFEVPNLHERARIWEAQSGHRVPVFIGDLTQWDFVEEVFQAFTPDAIVHYAEQPSAPYSMLTRPCRQPHAEQQPQHDHESDSCRPAILPRRSHCKNRHHGRIRGTRISISRKAGSTSRTKAETTSSFIRVKRAAFIIRPKSWILTCCGFMCARGDCA